MQGQEAKGMGFMQHQLTSLDGGLALGWLGALATGLGVLA